ncbi:MAG: DUF6531 domain-containing protein, partial [Acidobacteriota bacterium]|nr:DUF6531 domain-containing protein [Acidobacteriota bacterium]
ATFTAAGTYVLRLTATDSQLTAYAETSVTVRPANQPPTVDAGAAQTIQQNMTAQLSGSAHDDGLPVGGSLSVSWSQLSGPGTVVFVDEHATLTGATFSATGTYALRLTATDSQLSASSDVTITVVDAQAPPTVKIETPADGSEATAPSSVVGTVGGSVSAWRLEYSLNTEDGVGGQTWTTFATGTGAVASGALGTLDPTLMLNGIYTVRLTAADAYGQTSSDAISVVVDKNLKVGNFMLAFTDLTVPLPGLSIDVVRSYDSRDKRTGDFGAGWTLALRNVRVEKSRVLGRDWFETKSNTFIPNYCLEAARPHIVTVTFPDNKTYKFQAATTPHCQQGGPISNATISFTPMPGTHGALAIEGASDALVAGSVPGPVDLISYDNQDFFNSATYRLTVEDGTQYVVDQQGGVKSVRDLSGNTLTVDASGIHHSNGQSVAFVRDPQGRITQITDLSGNSLYYTYDQNGDLASFKDREGNVTTYGYDSAHYLLTINDPRGLQPIRNEYDASGRLLSHTDAFGKTVAYTHDLAARRETVTDRLGNQTVFEYDADGNVLYSKDAEGGERRFTYDESDDLLTETDALGRTATYTYDAQGNRTSVKDALGHITSYTYDSTAHVLTATDALNHTTTNTYDPGGNLLSTKDALGNETKYTYNAFTGLRLSTTDARGGVTRYEYDSANNLTKQTDALGRETTYTYGPNRARTSQTVSRTLPDGTTETITTGYEYDHDGRLTKTTYPDGTTTKVEYNAIGLQGATVDQAGRRTEYAYDEMGRLTKTTYPDGKTEETTYDAEGRRLTTTDRAGRVTTFTYDKAGRLVKTKYADGTTTGTAYDSAGQVVSTTDALGHVTAYTYDDAGRRATVKDALGRVTAFEYDAAGNQTKVTDANNHSTRYEYDELSRRTKTVYPDDTFETVGYDELGRSVSKTDQAGKTTRFEYDKTGRLVKVTDALSQITQYGYDELGQQTSQTDANNHTTRYEYDALGRRSRRVLPLGQSETYAYNADGTLRSRTDFNGKTITYAYDSLRRLLSKTPDPSLNQPAVSFTYTAAGQRETMTDATGTTTYAYDARNRLLSRATPNGTLTYTYDDAGNLKTVRSSNANGASVDYGYDLLNRLSQATDNRQPAGRQQTTYAYDNVGNLQSYAYPNQVTSTYTYNSLNRLTSLSVGNTSSTLAGYAYTLGAAGNRLGVTESNGRSVSYTYDDLYRLTGEIIANDPANGSGAIGYTYDAVGNRLTRTSSQPAVSAQTSAYDEDDRLKSDGYDANGNTTSSQGSHYTYDFENHLTSANDGAVTYQYDGDGNRVAKTVGGVTTKYLVDTNSPTGYAQVVDELQGGSVVRSYAYGHERLSQRQLLTGNWVTSYYGYDGHGSVRLLTDPSGAVTDTYTYDAFGNLINSTGGTPNEYLYSGERLDANTGFYYLRARYMNPSSGRFWTMDSYEGGNSDPLSLHKYLYGAGNAVNNVDPDGHMSLGEAVQVVTVSSVLANLSIFTIAGISAGLHNFSVDGALISFRGNLNARGFTFGAGVDIIWQRSTGRWFFAGTGEVGTSPLALFKKHAGPGYGVALGIIVGMNSPSEMSGFAATATVPGSALRLLPGSLFSENKAWGALTQLAKRNLHTGFTDLTYSVGISSSGPSYATLGIRSNSFNSLVSYTGEYHPADSVMQEIRSTAGALFSVVEGGMLSSSDSIGANAGAITSALVASNSL